MESVMLTSLTYWLFSWVHRGIASLLESFFMLNTLVIDNKMRIWVCFWLLNLGPQNIYPNCKRERKRKRIAKFKNWTVTCLLNKAFSRYLRPCPKSWAFFIWARQIIIYSTQPPVTACLGLWAVRAQTGNAPRRPWSPPQQDLPSRAPVDESNRWKLLKRELKSTAVKLSTDFILSLPFGGRGGRSLHS